MGNIFNGETMAWEDDGQPAFDPNIWDISAGGDYRRQKRQADDTDPNYWGGAGAAHVYDFQKKNAQGAWDFVNPGEHNEGADYFWNGVNAPGYLTALQKAGADRSAIDTARLERPDALGQALMRSEQSLTGGGNEDDWRQELAFYTGTPQLGGLSQYMTPEMQAQIKQQLNDSSASAQSARADADDGFGDFLKIAAPMALMAFGIPALSGLGGAASAGIGGATAEGLLAADMAGGLLPEFGSLAGEGLIGGISGAGLESGGLSQLSNAAYDWGLPDFASNAASTVADGAVDLVSQGSYPWLDQAGNLDVDKFLNMTAPGGEYASVIPGGAQGIPGIGVSEAGGFQGLIDKFLADPLSSVGKVLGKALNVTDDNGDLDIMKLIGKLGSAGLAWDALNKAKAQGDQNKVDITGYSKAFQGPNDALAPTYFKSMTQAAAPRKAEGGLVQYQSGGSVPKEEKTSAWGAFKSLVGMDETSADQKKAEAERVRQANMTPEQIRKEWEANLAADAKAKVIKVEKKATGGYLAGGTSGQSDKIPAMLSDGEYVFDADTVAALGDGNNAAGAAALDQMRQHIRKHKRSAPVNKIPPKAKKPQQYLKGAK